MRKILVVASLLIFAACSSTKNTGEKALYQVLTMQSNGGASIRFNEILTEEKEIKMLQYDENLRKKINPQDLTQSNFVIINLGEKNTDGYLINVKSVEELPDKIVISVEEIAPKQADAPEADIYFFPYTIIKVNSKKPIVIK
ncbi:MAG TPA: protease complex subunit PrcB family protein [Flavobacterium sp.]|nr:protease complex subunit PrcB family protein [Flavobacterium sp.]HPJ10022.1 protease complex subunit PrcB family protein [Flavobacterium sp.]